MDVLIPNNDAITFGPRQFPKGAYVSKRCRNYVLQKETWYYPGRGRGICWVVYPNALPFCEQKPLGRFLTRAFAEAAITESITLGWPLGGNHLGDTRGRSL